MLGQEPPRPELDRNYTSGNDRDSHPGVTKFIMISALMFFFLHACGIL